MPHITGIAGMSYEPKRRKKEIRTYMSPVEFELIVSKIYRTSGRPKTDFSEVTGVSYTNVLRYSRGTRPIPKYIAMLTHTMFALCMRTGEVPTKSIIGKPYTYSEKVRTAG